MKLFVHMRESLRRMVLPLFLIFLVVYTFSQMFTGERGLWVWYDLHDHIRQLEQQNAALDMQARALEGDVNRLREGSMDIDYVDELSRRMLGVTKPREEVILLPAEKG